MKQLIDKSAITAEIKRKIEAHKETLKNCDSSISEMVLKGSMSAYQNLLHFLDTLETKEVDLEKELDKYTADNFWALEGNNESPYLLEKDDILKVAKHFYELGLKAQEGE